MKKYTYTIGVALLSSFFTLVVCGIAAIFLIVQPFHKEAVERGFANWEVINNATGATRFTWNEFAYAVHPDNILDEIEQPIE